MGWLPAEEICIFHVFKGILHYGQTTVCINDLCGAPLCMVRDKHSTAQALVSETLQRFVINTITEKEKGTGELLFSFKI
jgi:hypothetical protein